MLDQLKDTAIAPSCGQAASGDIAIVGVSGRYPGGANSPQLLWDKLIRGEDAVSDIKGDRWDRGWHNVNQDRLDRIYATSAGLLDQIDEFDADFFGISPREAKQIDPQQRLLLELAWEAFESAGIPARASKGRDVGVFVGISNNDYGSMAVNGQPDAYTNTGVAFSIAANRVSYVFDLHGPSMAVDTACSSSLVAIHQACRAILGGDCRAALAGGVNVLADVKPWLGFSRASMLSPDGRCKSFDESGNGYVRAEGGGFVLLKRLEDAERDGDNILCVIKASGVNSDGRTMGLSMPNGDSQAALLAQIYGEGGPAAEDVFYVEAHGTGTSVGDPIECAALGQVLGATRAEGVCHIGSIKSNIGHLESGSGIAGLTKIIMAMQHRIVPANLHFNSPNPKIEFDSWKLGVVAEPLPFPEGDAPVMMGINSFGFGGTNAHLVIEEYRAGDAPVPVAAAAQADAFEQVLVISASSEGALQALARGYAAELRAEGADLAAILAGAAHCRAPLRMRLAVSGTTAAEVAGKLDDWLTGSAGVGVSEGTAASAQVPMAFVFSGNGPQWWGMGREMLAGNGVFRARVEAIDATFKPLSGWSLIEEMARPEAESRIELTEIAQPMLFALQMGLSAAFKARGIVPDALFGHSVGEVAAACASGALSLEQATRVIYERSHAQAATAGLGKMAALGLNVDAAEAQIEAIGGWLEIAAVNGPDAVTVAGDEASLVKLVDAVVAGGQFARLLKLDYPFHTRAMDRTKDALFAALGDLAPSQTEIPFISTVTGAALEGSNLDARYWFDNVRQPVLFSQAVGSLLSDHGVMLFVEIGPHPVLKDYVGQCAKAAGAPAVALQSLRRPSSKGPESDVENFAGAVAATMAHGGCDLTDLAPAPARRPNLPLYPWQRSRHWRGNVGLPDAFVPAERVHPLLGARLPRTDGLWENVIDQNVLAYLKDHVVQQSVLFPAAGYLELMIAAARQTHGPDHIVEIENFAIERPLVLPAEYDPLVQTLIDARDGTAEISSRRDRDAADHTVHARARTSASEEGSAPAMDLAAIRARTPVALTAADHYAACSFRGLDYGPMFQGVQSIQMTVPDAERREALAEIDIAALTGEALGDYRSHPSIFDSCIQVAIALVAQNDARNVSTIPVQFEKVRSFAPLPARVVCMIEIERETSRSVVATVRVCAPDGQLLMEVIGGRCTKANLTGAALSPLTAEAWRPDPAHPMRGALPALPELPKDMGGAVAAYEAEGEVRAAMEALAGGYAVQAIDALRDGAEQFDVASLARGARIRRDGQPLLTRLLDSAEAQGAVTREGRRFRWVAEAAAAPDALWDKTFRAYPAHQAELLLLAEAGESLVARLKGEDLPQPDLDQVRDVAPLSAALNGLCADALAALVAKWPAERPMRILEIGGGSGALASWLLPVLPAGRADYVFSDPSEKLLAQAERRLAAHRFVRCAHVEPALAPAEQGLPLDYFDLVIATGAADFGKSAAAFLEALGPVLADGAMILAPVPPSGPAAEMMFGEQVALSEALLSQAGFDGVEARTRGTAEVLVGRYGQAKAAAVAAPADESQSYLLLAEEPGGFAESVRAELEARGQAAALIGFPDGAGVQALETAIADAQATRVVLLGARRCDDAPEAMLEAQTRRSLVAVDLVAAMEAARGQLECSLSIVTRGAFPTGNGTGPLDPSEGALWGMGRVIGNEAWALETRLIDLHGSEESAAEAGWLAEELLRRDDESEVQIAGGHRFVARTQMNTPGDEARLSGQTAEEFQLDFVPQGGIGSLHLKATEPQAPGDDEIKIAVKAAGLNFRDVLWAMGMLPEEAVEHGFSGPTIGMECAGEVVSVGAGVSHIAPGDRVLAFASSCFGSHVVTEAKSVEKMPDGMEYAEAATIPTTFLTAWYGLDYLARLEEDEVILIHGAAGGVGLAAIQIAQAKGAVVIGTAGSPQKRRMLERLGVDHVLNSRTLEFADQVMEITGGKGVDVILNSLAGEAILKGLNCLRPFGRFLEIGKRDLYANSRIGLRPFRNNLSYFGIDADTLLIERPKLAGRLFGEVIAQFRAGDLTPLPHKVLPISRAGEAFRAMQQSKHVGKLVVAMDRDRADALNVVSAEGPVRAGGTYLVTGGLAGFGLATARWLVDQGATSLALVSRSGAASDEAKAAVAELEAAGAQVRAFACDISNRPAVDAMLARIRADMAPITGVFHSAAVIEDAPIGNIEKDQLERVYLPKMIGAWNLHQATLGDPIEAFVLYSSSSAVVGNPGQGAYVAANLYLDTLALHRRAEGLPALSVAWGAIRDAGFLTRHEKVAEMLKTRTGLDATPAREALGDLARAMAAGARRVSVARFDLQMLHQMLPAAQTPRFAPIIPKDAMAANASEESLYDILMEMPVSERRGFILERVTESTARVIGTSASQINADLPLSDLGLDSLMAVELAGAIERDIGDSVPVMQLLGVPSLAAVVDFVAGTLGIEIDEGGAPAADAGQVSLAAAE